MKMSAMTLVAWFCLALVGTDLCHAQSEEGIKGQGESVLELKAEVLRMRVDVRISGKDLPDALKKLKARRTEVEKELEKMGATKGSIKFAEPEIDNTIDQKQQQMQQFQRQMAQAQGRALPDKSSVPKLAKVMSTVMAEWPMPKGDAAELLVASQKLQEEVKEADFGGTQESSDATAEEEEVNEEMNGMNGMTMQFGNDGSPKPGEPSFIFVTKISPAARAKTIAEAFRNAKSNAAELAKAAEVELGAVSSLSSTANNNLGNSSGGGVYSPYSYATGYQGSTFSTFFPQNGVGNNRNDEAYGTKPTEVKLQVTVIASFAVK